jgi:hypothetical protein
MFPGEDEEFDEREYDHALDARHALVDHEVAMRKNIVADADDGNIVYNKGLINWLVEDDHCYCSGLVERLVIGRDGELTCPVRAGFVFGREADSRKWEDREAWLADLRESLSTLSGFNDILSVDMVVERSRQGTLPRVESASLFLVQDVEEDEGNRFQSGSCFVEFQRKPRGKGASAWAVIGFFSFNCVWNADMLSNALEGKIAVRYQSEEDDFSRELTVELTKARMVNSVAVKLISQENLMDLYNDMHPAPNIDISRFIIEGRAL